MDTQCSICLENVTEKSMTMPECSHVFHSSCIMKYIESNIPKEITCPICRKSVIRAFSLEPSTMIQVPLPIIMQHMSAIPSSTVQDTYERGYISLNQCRMILLSTIVLLGVWIYMTYDSIHR